MVSANIVQTGKGKGRSPWKIREFLSARGLNMSKVAEKAETWPQIVHDTVYGRRNHRRTLNVLENLGCPTEYLYGNGDSK